MDRYSHQIPSAFWKTFKKNPKGRPMKNWDWYQDLWHKISPSHFEDFLPSRSVGCLPFLRLKNGWVISKQRKILHCPDQTLSWDKILITEPHWHGVLPRARQFMPTAWTTAAAPRDCQTPQPWVSCFSSSSSHESTFCKMRRTQVNPTFLYPVSEYDGSYQRAAFFLHLASTLLCKDSH